MLDDVDKIVEDYVRRECRAAIRRAKICGCSTCKARRRDLVEWVAEVGPAGSVNSGVNPGVNSGMKLT